MIEANANPLSQALHELYKHIKGTPLEPQGIIQKIQLIEENPQEIGSSITLIKQAFAVVKAYQDHYQPLFLNEATKGGFSRANRKNYEIHHAIFTLQQAILDHVYNSSNLKKYYPTLRNLSFKTSEYFPGSTNQLPNPKIIYKIKINASHPKTWGYPVKFYEDPARRPTGSYLSPGTIVRVTVPKSLVNQGYAIRIGSHSWDFQNKKTLKRLDRVSLTYPIQSASTLVANPLGGGIYIDVPYLAKAGIVTIEIQNAIRSPFYSSKPFHQTSLQQWEQERQHPAPWADFETEKYMLNLPSDFIRDFETPDKMLRDWDTAMDTVSQLLGRPLIRSKTVLYHQFDVSIRLNKSFSTGYPQTNMFYRPYRENKGKKEIFLGPQNFGFSTSVFHELGHAESFTKFPGEEEAAVYLLYAAVLNKGFSVPLEEAFMGSLTPRSYNLRPNTTDQVAINWMVTENFRMGKPMETNRDNGQIAYQYQGYAKYIDIVKLFGWEALEKFWKTEQEAFHQGTHYILGIGGKKHTVEESWAKSDWRRSAKFIDEQILDLSIATGYDLTPLIHFWGTHPKDPQKLKKKMQIAGLKPSPQIYQLLNHRKKIIPKDSATFQSYVKSIWPIREFNQNKLKLTHKGVGLMTTLLPLYDPTLAQSVEKAIQKIIETYFPNGLPQ